MGLDLHTNRALMVAIHRSQMKTNEYVYIIPWLAHVPFCLIFLDNVYLTDA